MTYTKNFSMKNYIYFFYLIPLIFTWSCATYTSVDKSSKSKTQETSTESKIQHSFYLLGNLADGEADLQEKTLQSLQKELSGENENSTVLWLGNNLYFPSKSTGNLKQEVKKAIAPLANSVQNFSGNNFYVPGYQDWKLEGIDGLNTIEDQINHALGKGTYLPKHSCPIKYEEVGEHIVLIFVNAQWFIENWDNHPNINTDCKINNRTRFFNDFSDNVKKARGKTTLIVMSQPVYSAGKKGGYYSAASGLTPLPVLGNLKNIVRRTGGFKQEELFNKFYTDLRIRLMALARQNDHVIFTSAHENSLQYIEYNKIPQIISGAASKTSRARNQKSLQFYKNTTGYAKVLVYEDGSSEVQFIDANTQEKLYNQKIYTAIKNEVREYPVLKKDSIEASILTKKETRTFFLYRWLVGNRYRKYYSMPIETKVAYLDSLQGGLTPIRQGGGHQSVSLHLEGKDGKAYVMRAMKKNSAQYMQSVTFRDTYMQEELENTVATRLLQDFFTGSYPYSILLAEGLSEKINIPTQNSHIYYIPKQEALGRFNQGNGDKLYVVESHPKKGSYQLGTVSFEGNVIDTYKMMNNLREDEKYKIDQKQYLKARLFDMLIGDWDRHEDQWKWLEYEEEDNIVYRPLPRDRDQAFNRLGDGLATKIALFFSPDARLIKNYCGDLKGVKFFNKEPFPMDVSFLKELTLNDWIEQATLIQKELNDEAIDEVFDKLPKELKDKMLDKNKKYLKQRRDNLQKIAKRYYNRVARIPKVIGTDKDDYFRIEIKENKEVEVSVYRIKKGEYKDRFHHRIYKPSETKELWIYGLNDKDVFEVIGKGSLIKIILVGGRQNDQYKVPHHNKVHIYDAKKKPNTYDEAKKAKLHIHNIYGINSFNYKKTFEDHYLFIPSLAINQDVGTKIGFVSQIQISKFKGGYNHSIQANYFTAPNSITFNYSGKYPLFVGTMDLNLNAEYNNDKYTMNFFGWGNETKNAQDSLSRIYNRVSMTGYKFNPVLTKSYYKGWNWNFETEFYGMKLIQGQESISYHSDELPEYLFKQNHFLTLGSSVSYSNQDYPAFPTNALNLNLRLAYTQNLTHQENNFFKLQPQINWNYKLVPSGRVVWASALKGEFIFGDGYEFFQSAYLGGDNGLRGYRNQRFAGKNSFINSNDIRFSLNRNKTFIVPMRLGLYAGLDYGRVWYPEESSSKWYTSRGGGLFVVFAESSTLNVGGFNTEEGTYWMLNMGFNF